MRIALHIIVAFASLTSVPAAFASPEDRAQQDEKLICKHNRQTGTRFTKKVCKTAAQWDRMAEEHRSVASEMVNRPLISIDRGN
jgi:hypothetical protein